MKGGDDSQSIGSNGKSSRERPRNYNFGSWRKNHDELESKNSVGSNRIAPTENLNKDYYKFIIKDKCDAGGASAKNKEEYFRSIRTQSDSNNNESVSFAEKDKGSQKANTTNPDS